MYVICCIHALLIFVLLYVGLVVCHYSSSYTDFVMHLVKNLFRSNAVQFSYACNYKLLVLCHQNSSSNDFGMLLVKEYD